MYYIDNPTLGQWCNTQRRRYRVKSTASKGRKIAPLTKEQINKLYTVAFRFQAKNVRRGKNVAFRIQANKRVRGKYKIKDYLTRWNERFEELKTFYKKNGHSNVPARYQDNPPLGQWCSTQRTCYRVNLQLAHQSKSDSIAVKKPSHLPLTKEKINKLHTVAFRFPEEGHK